MAELWHRQPGETRKAFEAFRIYRDMGDERTLMKVGETLEKSWKLIGRWSAKYKWADRIRAYDNFLDAKRVEKNRKKIIEMNEYQAQLGRTLQNLGGVVINQVINEVNRLLQEARKPGADSDKINGAIQALLKKIGTPTASSLIVSGSRVERIALIGESGEGVKQDHSGQAELEPEVVERLMKALEIKATGDIRQEVAERLYDEWMGGSGEKLEEATAGTIE